MIYRAIKRRYSTIWILYLEAHGIWCCHLSPHFEDCIPSLSVTHWPRDRGSNTKALRRDLSEVIVHLRRMEVDLSEQMRFPAFLPTISPYVLWYLRASPVGAIQCGEDVRQVLGGLVPS